MRRIAVTALLAAMSVEAFGMSDEDIISKAQEAVALSLKDPESARFRDVFVYRHQSSEYMGTIALCGLVNAKNSYGGYKGYRRFSTQLDVDSAEAVKVLGVQMDEGDNLRKSGEGLTFFEQFHWRGLCAPGESAYEASQRMFKERWSVQVTSVSDPLKAEPFEKKIHVAGMESYRVEKDGVIRVFAGPFPNKPMAELMRDTLKTRHKLDGIVARPE